MRFDVAREFAHCVKAVGGVVLDETLHRPLFPNADYWFPRDNVVAELKCLSENLAAKSEFNESLTTLHASWVKRGLVPPATQIRAQINPRDLPIKCAHEFIEPIKKRLEASTIRKANRQIQETKRHFGATDAKGLLLLANDGNYMLPPTMMVHLLPRILSAQYSSINSVIYFSINETTTAPGVPTPALFWIDGVLPGRDAVSLEFRRSIRTEWMRHYSRLVPEPVYEFDGHSTPDLIDNIQFFKNGRK